MSKKSTVVLPQTQQILDQMGEQIRLARLRRHLSAELVAERAGISRMTLSNIEKGSPSVAIGSYAAVLHALNGMDKDLLLVAKDDELGRKLQDLELPTRCRAPKKRECVWQRQSMYTKTGAVKSPPNWECSMWSRAVEASITHLSMTRPG